MTLYEIASRSQVCQLKFLMGFNCVLSIIESIDSICRDSMDTQYMAIQIVMSYSSCTHTVKSLINDTLKEDKLLLFGGSTVKC